MQVAVLEIRVFSKTCATDDWESGEIRQTTAASAWFPRSSIQWTSFATLASFSTPSCRCATTSPVQHIHVSIICVDCGSPSLARPRRHSATRLRFRLIPARLLYRRPHWPSSVSIGTAATSSTCCRTSRTGHSSTWSRDTGVARATLLADRANNWLQTVFVSLQADREPIGRQSTCLTCWHQLPTSRRGRCARALTATTSSVELLSGSATGRSQSLPPAPRAWNRPPSELKTTTCSVETFKRRLKTVFFI